MFQRVTLRWRYEDILQVQHCSSSVVEVHLDHWLSLNNSDLNMFVHWFIIWSSFFAPSWSEYCLFFLFRVYCIAPRWLNFSRSVEKSQCYLCQGFADSIDVLLCSIIFLVLESNLIFQRSCLFKSNCWNEIREISVLEKIFWKSSFLLKDLTHVIQKKKYSLLIVLCFENRNWPVVRLKWLFHGSLYPF